ncbi:carboxypeptidase regulatory-like domain-containing protein [Sorangium sp. So ce1335]|uniref:carboxypeptidase regulatory-like domain-containing protein n=1 Tax=Sorangium sp. So ce1335 TaxID=3133335 RepID=UPI003F647E48
MGRLHGSAGWLLASAAIAPALIAGCSCGDPGGTPASASSAGGGGAAGAAGAEPDAGGGFGGIPFYPGGGGSPVGTGGCEGLECQQIQCAAGGKTTVSGTVYEPAGKVPLYNVIVYVPNSELDPITDGASCDRCNVTLSGDPIATALTDTKGRFVLEDVPVGEDIPLVVQIGKWRRKITLPRVEACVDNPLEDGAIRLPRNKSEGHIPKIALTTGGADVLECLLYKMGIDASEFTPETGDGRVNLFTGRAIEGRKATSRYRDGLNDGASFSTARSFWGSLDNLSQYDMVILSCEGSEFRADKPQAALQAMFDYASAGGRVFASHWHNTWLRLGPGRFPETADWNEESDPDDELPVLVDTTFPKGEALRDWLVAVEASREPGQILIDDPQHWVDSVNEEIATRWLFNEAHPTLEAKAGVKYFTFNTPIGSPEEAQCGRFVYTDIHVATTDVAGAPFPSGCESRDGEHHELTAQEKALLFMLFDLSACIAPDDEPPPVPVPR